MAVTYTFRVVETQDGRHTERDMSFEELFRLQEFAQSVEDTADNPLQEAALSDDQTENSETFANTLLNAVVEAGGSYIVFGFLVVSNTVPQDGLKMDFNGGDAIADIFQIRALSVGTNNAQNTGADAIDTPLNYTSITGTNRIWFTGYLKAQTAGNFTLRVALDSTSTGVLTLHKGSWIDLHEIVER
jgi:hypothetical protein